MTSNLPIVAANSEKSQDSAGNWISSNTLFGKENGIAESTILDTTKAETPHKTLKVVLENMTAHYPEIQVRNNYFNYGEGKSICYVQENLDVNCENKISNDDERDVEIGYLFQMELIESNEELHLDSKPVHSFKKTQKKLNYPNKLQPRERTTLNSLFEGNYKYQVLYIQPIYDIDKLRGQTTFVIVGDEKGRFGYSLKYSSDRFTSIREAIERAITNSFSINLYSYKSKAKNRYTITNSCTGKSGDMIVTLIPSFSGSGILNSNGIITKMLKMAKITDCEVKIENQSKFVGDVGKATFEALCELEIDADVALINSLTHFV